MEPISFDWIEDNLACIKELQLKLGECGKYFPKKGWNLIELVLMNFKSPYDVLFSSFHDIWMSHKQDGKDFTFDIFYDLLIKYQQNLLEKGNLDAKN